ncbi:MAG: heme-binding domain-containing protein [Deltaproteobacteria bacterium]|nr:heme-binding domain-containing protein [Deltaproteobacteria bacterium]
MLKVALVSFAVLCAAIQLIPVSRSNPPAARNPEAPTAIVRLLTRACYDCHSNQTRWPWYSFIAPASWLVSRHVAEARRRLNFSEWGAYASDPDTASHKLAEIADQVASGKMAPWYYRAMHRDAWLNPAERQALIRWARASSAAMRSSQ